jgi:kynurenine formamidase
MVDQQYCASCHFSDPPESIDNLSLFSAFLECVVFDIVELETAHDETVDRIDDQKPSFSSLFHPF